MDKTELYYILDIENADDFKYYENVSALIEEPKYIEQNLIKDLLKDIDVSVLSESLDTYFEDLLKNLPDEETDLYITVDNIKRVLLGRIADDMDSSEIEALAVEIGKFRKWYVLDSLVFDKTSGTEISVMEARYNLQASKFTQEECNYDYRLAYNYDFEGYDVRVSDMINSDTE